MLANYSYLETWDSMQRSINNLRASVSNPNEATKAMWAFEDQRNAFMRDYYEKMDAQMAERKAQPEELNISINSETKVK